MSLSRAKVEIKRGSYLLEQYKLLRVIKQPFDGVVERNGIYKKYENMSFDTVIEKNCKIMIPYIWIYSEKRLCGKQRLFKKY
jgi:hypothetical protein